MPDAVLGAGYLSPNLLAFTNFTDRSWNMTNTEAAQNTSASGSGSGPSGGVIAAIVVPVVLLGEIIMCYCLLL